MTFYRNTAEGGSNGATVTVDNSGDESGDAFTIIGGAPTFASAAALSGARGISCAPAGTAQSYVGFTLTGGLKLLTSTRFYFRLVGYPGAAGTATLLYLANTGNTGQRTMVRVSPAGILSVANAASTAIWTATSALALNTRYRIEMGVNITTGAIAFRTFLGDALTPIPEMSTDLTGASIGAPNGVAHVLFGYRTIVTSAGVLHLDDMAVDDTSTTLLGPIGKSEIPVTATSIGGNRVQVSWTHPADAPQGVSICRANGLQANDGNGNPPHHPSYDPTTIPGAAIVASHLSASPYVDNGVALGNWTYWVARTA